MKSTANENLKLGRVQTLLNEKFMVNLLSVLNVSITISLLKSSQVCSDSAGVMPQLVPLNYCSESSTQAYTRFSCNKVTQKIKFLASSHAKDTNYPGQGQAGTISSGSIQGKVFSGAPCTSVL